MRKMVIDGVVVIGVEDEEVEVGVGGGVEPLPLLP
jgi:hypothetical protein